MKNIKKLIIILILILILIICLGLFLVLKSKEKDEKPVKPTDSGMDISSEESISRAKIVDNNNTYFSAEAMLNNYIRNIHFSHSNQIYNLLEQDYIAQNNLTVDNILQHVSNMIKYNAKSKIRNIYEKQNANNEIYYIDCMLEKEHVGDQFYFILYTDKQNSTYCVQPIDKNIYEQELKNTNKNESKHIEKNENNSIILETPTEKQIVNKYFESFLDNALYYTEYAYNSLDKKYRDLCFPTIEDFSTYINNKREMFLSYDMANMKTFSDFETMDEYMLYIGQVKNLKLSQYQIIKNEDYTTYVCIDSEDNFYTFYATSPFNYTVALGNYVIPVQDFIDQYSKSTQAQKCILNIQRFFMGINDKNYGYSYSVLSEGFRNNYYPTKNNFINYVKQNFFEQNEVEYLEYEKQNDIYIYKIKVTDATKKSSVEKSFNAIVKLNNGTDFEMSFGTD